MVYEKGHYSKLKEKYEKACSEADDKITQREGVYAFNNDQNLVLNELTKLIDYE